MKKKIGLTIVIVLLLGVLGGLIYVLVQGESSFGNPQSTEAGPPALATVSKGTVTQRITGAGEVKPSSVEKLKPGKWQYFDSTVAPRNKLVKEGDVIMKYTSDEVMVAPFDLVIKSYSMPEHREELSQDDHYVEVQRVNEVAITLDVPESDLKSLAVGQEVSVVLNADESKTYEGSIYDISEIGTYNATGSKFTVTVLVWNDRSILLGMSASLSIKVKEAVDVLTVPVSAVSGSGDNKTVTVYSPADGSMKTVAVTTGISDGTMVEISGAINEGDSVVAQEASLDSQGSSGSLSFATSAG